MPEIAGKELVCPSVNKAPDWNPADRELPIATYLEKSIEPDDVVTVGGAGDGVSSNSFCLHDCAKNRVTMISKKRNFVAFII